MPARATRVLTPSAETAAEATAALDAIERDETVYEETEDMLSAVPGFKAITAYSIQQPNLTITYETASSLNDSERDDPKHIYRPNRQKIKFTWGAFLCTHPIHVEVLKNKPGIYFDNLPDGTPSPVCPKASCRFSCRNHDAMLAHVAMHID